MPHTQTTSDSSPLLSSIPTPSISHSINVYHIQFTESIRAVFDKDLVSNRCCSPTSAHDIYCRRAIVLRWWWPGADGGEPVGLWSARNTIRRLQMPVTGECKSAIEYSITAILSTLERWQLFTGQIQPIGSTANHFVKRRHPLLRYVNRLIWFVISSTPHLSTAGWLFYAAASAADQ